MGKIGYKHSEKTKEKLSFLAKNRTLEHRMKISEALKGRKLSDEMKRKIGLANKGKKLSSETKLKMSKSKLGCPGYFKGKKLSEEHKRKIGESHKGIKVKPFSAIARKNISESRKGRRYSDERNKKISLALRGEKSYNWKGGATPINRQIKKSEKYKQWRQQIFLRDDFTCKECNQKGGILHPHHKIFFSKLMEEVRFNLPLIPLYDAAMIYTPLWDINNGMTLCKECHYKLHRKNRA